MALYPITSTSTGLDASFIANEIYDQEKAIEALCDKMIDNANVNTKLNLADFNSLIRLSKALRDLLQDVDTSAEKDIISGSMTEVWRIKLYRTFAQQDAVNILRDFRTALVTFVTDAERDQPKEDLSGALLLVKRNATTGEETPLEVNSNTQAATQLTQVQTLRAAIEPKT